MQKDRFLFICVFLLSLLKSTLAFSLNNYHEAKVAAKKIFAVNPITLYCGCNYDLKTKEINIDTCNYKPEANSSLRSRKMEFEHMMPMEHIGRNFECWREKKCSHKNGKKYGGRKCCQKIDPLFRAIEGDLYNLWPAVGKINKLRSNFRYGVITSPQTPENGILTAVDNCEVKIDFKRRIFEPPNIVKGIVARANLYMADKYGIKLSKSQQQLFYAWDKMFPPTEWEKKWASQISLIQRNNNPFILNHIKN